VVPTSRIGILKMTEANLINSSIISKFISFLLKKFSNLILNRDKYGIESSYDENVYTTKLDQDKLTEEQKQKATRLAKEIENGKKNKRKQNYNEDDDEEMDNGSKTNQDVGKIVGENKIYSMEEIEAQQMSNRSVPEESGSSKRPEEIATKEITKDDMLKKQSVQSTNDFDIEGLENKNSSDQFFDDENLERSFEGSEPRSSMKLSSTSFTPKNGLKGSEKSSTKSIDEFDIQEGVNNPEDKPKTSSGASKLKPTTRTFTPGMKSKPFVPSDRKSTALTSSTTQNSSIPIPAQPYVQQNLSQSTMLPPTVGFQQPQQQFQQNWQGNFGGNPSYQYDQNMSGRVGPKSNIAKNRYYKLDPLMDIEELFSFDTLFNAQKTQHFYDLIQNKKEECRVIKTPNMTHKSSYPSRGGYQQPQSYMGQSSRGRGGLNKSLRGKPESKSGPI